MNPYHIFHGALTICFVIVTACMIFTPYKP